jgi:hypothetical protein
MLGIWAAVVFAVCAVTKSRVLRYLLPAYPAFSIMAAIAVMRYVPQYIGKGLRVLIPLYGVVALWIAIFPPVNWQAKNTRPVALAATAATHPGEVVTFYDRTGDARWDETNQILWYGDRLLLILRKPEDVVQAVEYPPTRVFIVDPATYQEMIESRVPNRILIRTGSLVCVRMLAAET